VKRRFFRTIPFAAAIVALALGAPPAVSQPGLHASHGAEEPFCGSGDELAAVLDAIARARGPEWASSALRPESTPPFGDVFVIEDDGSLTFFGITDSPRIIRRFYQTYRDDFDLIAIYNDFDAIPEFGFAYNDPVVNRSLGIGFPVMDMADTKRFPTARLLSYQNLNSLVRYPDDPSAPIPGLFNGLLDSVEVLAHEVGHQWMAKLALSNGDLLGRNQVHWSFVLDTAASVMEGNRFRDNGDRTYTTVDALRTYSPLDHYLMGLRRRDELPAQFVLENWTGPREVPDDAVFPLLGVTITGDRRDFGIADVEAANGVRVPAAGAAPFVFRLAVILLVDQGTYPPPAATIAKLDRIRLGYEAFFRRETEGRGYLVTALCPPEAETRHVFPSPAGEGSLAGSATSAGVDVDLDGAGDYAIGSPGANGGRGTAVVHSGLTGARLVRADGESDGERLGSAVALLRDADGRPGGEAVLGSPGHEGGRGRVRVVSVSDGRVVADRPGANEGEEFGAAVAPLRDVDGDGGADFAAGAPGANEGAGLVRIVSGRTGATIREIRGATPGERFGEAIATVPDFDSDGVPDLLVGSPSYSPEGAIASAGAATLVSTATGAAIRRFEGDEAGARLGAAVASVPDATGDDVPEFLLGAPLAGAGRGAVLLLSGAGDAPVLVLSGSGPKDRFGSSVAGLADVSGDGRGDVVVGAPGASPGARPGAGVVLAFSGADGALLSVWAGASARDALGAAVSSDGGLSVVAGAPREAGFGAARVVAYESFHLFSLGCPKGGRDLTLEVWGDPSEQYAIVASSRVGPGLTPVPYPAGPGSASALDVGLERRRLTRAVPGFLGRLSAGGRAALTVRIPARPELVGRTVGFQAASIRSKSLGAPRICRLSRPVVLTIR